MRIMDKETEVAAPRNIGIELRRGLYLPVETEILGDGLTNFHITRSK